MTLPKHEQAAAIVRDRIEAGALLPGRPAPSGAELARLTGFALLTCRRALRALVRDGTLAPGPSPNARYRVAAGRTPDPADALSAALAARRHAAGLTQLELAALVGRSVTTVGHAETGRLWQGRQFWENADKALNARGELLNAHDAYRAAIAPHRAPEADIPEPPVGIAAVLIPAPASLDDQDPAVLNLLRLAAEAIIAHPDAVPTDLLSLLDAYAADLCGTLAPRPRHKAPASALRSRAATAATAGAPRGPDGGAVPQRRIAGRHRP